MILGNESYYVYEQFVEGASMFHVAGLVFYVVGSAMLMLLMVSSRIAEEGTKTTASPCPEYNVAPNFPPYMVKLKTVFKASSFENKINIKDKK